MSPYCSTQSRNSDHSSSSKPTPPVNMRHELFDFRAQFAYAPSYASEKICQPDPLKIFRQDFSPIRRIPCSEEV